MIGITLILTTVFFLETNSTSLPKASYIKAVDVYCIATFINIAISVFESVIVYKLHVFAMRRNLKKKERMAKECKRPLTSPDDDSDIPDMVPEKRSDAVDQIQSVMWVKKVDMISRIIFPALFIIFNAVFLFKYQRDVTKQFNSVYAEATKALQKYE